MANVSNVTFLNADQIDFDRLIMHARTEFELLEICARVALIHGLPFFSVMRFPKATDKKLTSVGMVSNWPDTLIAEYDRLGLFENSPVIQHLKTSTEPLIFEIAKINAKRKDDKGAAAEALFRRYQINHGIYFSVHNAKGATASVSFTGPNPAADKETIIKLNYFASLIYSRLSVLRSEDDEAYYDLKPRELEFLQLVSEGKGISEIARDYGLSDMLFGRYLQSGAMKLGCDSRIHAVSKALRLKLIS